MTKHDPRWADWPADDAPAVGPRPEWESHFRGLAERQLDREALLRQWEDAWRPRRDMAQHDPDADFRRMTVEELEGSDTYGRDPRQPPGTSVVRAAVVSVAAMLLLWWLL